MSVRHAVTEANPTQNRKPSTRHQRPSVELPATPHTVAPCQQQPHPQKPTKDLLLLSQGLNQLSIGRQQQQQSLLSFASTSSFNLNSGIDGFVTLVGARSQNEDRVQTVISCEPHDPKVYCVHDGHGGDDAVKRLCTFMENHQIWVDCTKAQDKMHFLGDTYMRAIKHLHKHESGVVSITAFCDKEDVYLG